MKTVVDFDKYLILMVFVLIKYLQDFAKHFVNVYKYFANNKYEF